jgi:hypothetical protein
MENVSKASHPRVLCKKKQSEQGNWTCYIFVPDGYRMPTFGSRGKSRTPLRQVTDSEIITGVQNTCTSSGNPAIFKSVSCPTATVRVWLNSVAVNGFGVQREISQSIRFVFFCQRSR